MTKPLMLPNYWIFYINLFAENSSVFNNRTIL